MHTRARPSYIRVENGFAGFQMDLPADDEEEERDHHEQPGEEKVETDGHHEAVGPGAPVAPALARPATAAVHQPHAEEEGD